MLNCERATFLISQAQDRPLSRGERYSLALHTTLCKACRAFGAQIPLLRQAARAFARANPNKHNSEPEES